MLKTTHFHFAQTWLPRRLPRSAGVLPDKGNSLRGHEVGKVCNYAVDVLL